MKKEREERAREKMESPEHGPKDPFLSTRSCLLSSHQLEIVHPTMNLCMGKSAKDVRVFGIQNLLPKASSPNIVTLRTKCSICESLGTFQIQIIRGNKVYFLRRGFEFQTGDSGLGPTSTREDMWRLERWLSV